ncbi:MAG: DJ-1/PfpI family protein [Clostridiales bacterium]|nr:DJ-1/PfpI family protein [Clostridiales bacterium]
MAKVAVFIADGSEEVEAITPVDLLRRAKVDVDVVSIMDTLEITASRNVKITADKLIGDINFNDYDLLVLPGGVKGTNNLNACEALKEKLVSFNEQGKGIAAICAAPTVFAGLGLLSGKDSTCNPGFWDVLKANGANVLEDSKVVVDGNIITSQAMGTSVDFGLALVGFLCGEEASEELRKNIRFGAL